MNPRPTSSGFSLVEILITLGIISTVVVALLAILPVGMKSADDAGHMTIVAAVLEDVHNRVEGQPLRAGKLGNTPFFYSREGVFIPRDAHSEDKVDRLYRADVEIVAIDRANQPKNTSNDLMAAKVSLWWPVNNETASRSAKPESPRRRSLIT